MFLTWEITIWHYLVPTLQFWRRWQVVLIVLLHNCQKKMTMTNNMIACLLLFFTWKRTIMMMSNNAVHCCYLVPTLKLEEDDKLCSLSSFTVAKTTKKNKRMTMSSAIGCHHCSCLQEHIGTMMNSWLACHCFFHLKEHSRMMTSSIHYHSFVPTRP